MLPLILALVAGLFIYNMDGSLPVPGFYELAAQIIPILMIAFALENRAADLLSEPQMGLYRAQLFLFLLGGEIFALLGASGALRGEEAVHYFQQGYVASGAWLNIIPAATTAGLVGGFAMLTVLALFWGPGWILLSLRREPRPSNQEVADLEEKVRRLAQELDKQF